MASRNSRGRMIYWKISYCKQLADVSMLADLLFTWLIPNTDNLGRIEGDPKIIKGMIFPYHDRVTVKMIAAALKELKQTKLILWYEVEGNLYIQFPNFNKYQALEKNNAKRSDYPAPADITENVDTCSDMSLHVPCEGEGEGEGENAPAREDDKFQSAINDFKDFRKKIRKPMTEKAEQLLHKELDKLAADDETKIAILNRSIVNGWQGVFPLTESKATGPPGQKVPQHANFQQRKYDDKFYNELYYKPPEGDTS